MNTDFKYYKLTPFKWFILENFPFIEADFDALTNWQLFCKLGKEINKIIDSVNLSGDEVEKLSIAFDNLYKYVNDYFTHLDIEAEINNKLDEMAEDGTLAEIINQQIFDGLNTQIGELDTRVDNLETSNATKISSVFGCAPSSENSAWNQFYIDGELGSDENEGTQSLPFKTFVPIVNLINKGKLKFEVALKRNQVHILPVYVFNACTIHLSAYGDGNDNAVITTNTLPSVNSSLVFYNCHVNASNITFRNIGYDMYSDGGSFVGTNCLFDCKFTSWGAGIRFNDCTIKTLKLRMANAWIHGNNTVLGCLDSEASIIELYRATLNPSFNINHEKTESCYTINGGQISIYGATSISTDIQPAFNRLLYFICLNLLLSAGPNVTVSGDNFTVPSVIGCCNVVATPVRLNTLVTSANGIQFTDGSVYPQ